MNITEFREKYPMYNDISDSDIVDKLHSQFYSDIPKTDFVNKFLGEAYPKPEVSKSLSPIEKEFKDKPALERARIGAGKGFMDVARGIKQLGAKTGELMGMVDPETVKRITDEIEQEKLYYSSYAGDDTAAKVGEFVGQTAPTMLVPGGAAGGFARRLATGAAAGALTGMIQPTQTEGIDENLSNALTGGVMGAGGSAVMSGAGKLVNAIKPTQNTIQQLSKKYGIRTTLGEASDNPLIKRAETWLENIPIIGLRRFREKQDKEALNVAKSFMAKYMVDPTASEANLVNRAFSSSKYRELNNLVNGIADQNILPSQTQSAARSLLSRYPDIFKKFQDTKTEGLIIDIASGLKPKTNQNIVLNTNRPKELNFEQMWTLRDGLGEKIGQARKKLASGEIDHTMYSQMKTLYKAVNDDLDSWINGIGRPDVKEAITAANEAYKQFVVRYDVIRRAYDKAVGETGAGEMFSPKRFSTLLKNIVYKDKELKKFPADQIEEMTGLANIMQVVKRAGQYGENPPTGNRWGVILTGMVGGTAALPYVVITRILTGTESGKRLAMAASKVEPNSPAMAKIVDELYKLAPRAAASSINIEDITPEQAVEELNRRRGQ